MEKRSFFTISHLVALVLSIGGIVSLPAATLLDEDFGYPVGALAGENGGDGTANWAGAWTADQGTGADVSNAIINYPYLVESGNVASISANTRVARILDQHYGTINNTTVYLSFIMQTSGAPSAPYSALELYSSTLLSDSTRMFELGLLRSNGVSNNNFEATIGAKVNNSKSGDLANNDNNVHCFVVRFDFKAGNDIVNIFHNPDSSTDLTGAGNATITNKDITFQVVTMANFVSPGNDVSFDEIKFSSTPPELTELDTDGDGLSDTDEVNIHGTDPNDADSDDDGLTDYEEVITLSTDPNDNDSDDDGALDGVELVFGTNPNDGSSTPPVGATLSGMTPPGTVGSYIGTLPTQTPGAAIGTNWQLNNAFPNLNFAELKGVTCEPRTNFIYVVERRGTVQRVDFDPATTTKTQVLNIGAQVETAVNGGLRTLVFHPDFNLASSPNKDYVYAFYMTRAKTANGFTNPDNSYFFRVSRFTRNSSGSFPMSSEQVMIQQHARDTGSHFGGGMVFGLDGFLYITFGDLEFSKSIFREPFYQDSQRIDRIFQSAILRVDVDQIGGSISSSPTKTLQGNNGPNALAGTSRSCNPGHNYYHTDNHSGIGYFIPKTNFWHKDNNVPAAGSAGTSDGVAYPAHGAALEEHVAIGVRNPWRIYVDPVDGDIAWSIVGSNASTRYEETELLVNTQGGGVIGGGNYGWPYREAFNNKKYETGRDKPPGLDSFGPTYLGTEQDPLEYHPESQGRCGTGGLFYHGAKLTSQLANKIVIGDWYSGKIWSVDYKGLSTPVVTEMLDTTIGIRHIAASPDGEDILIVSDTTISLLDNSMPSSPEPPATLSATGFFTDLANLTPRSGAIPFEPAAPLWSDRAKKYRWIMLPNDQGTAGQYDDPAQKILFSENGAWVFPEGTVLVKHFSLPLDEGDPDNPALQQKIETRFLVRGEDGSYYGVTYKWRNDQTDADLVASGNTSLLDQDFTITREDDTTYTQTWKWPSRSNCFDCHQQPTGAPLGPRTYQLNSAMNYSGGGTANQLATLNQLGVFEQALSLSAFTSYERAAYIKDDTATLERRVHSYIASNCAHCHQPGANSGRAVFDARLATPIGLTGLINGEILAEAEEGLTDPRIVKPGDWVNSMIYHRDKSVDPSFMMPPLAKSIEDEVYIDILRRWIQRIGYTNFDNAMTASGVIGSLDDDDDGDGILNKVEFLLGTQAHVPNAKPHFSPVKNGNDFELTIPLKGAAIADGIHPRVWGSSNLLDWFPAGDVSSMLELQSDSSAPGVDGDQVWRFISAPRAFLRFDVGP